MSQNRWRTSPDSNNANKITPLRQSSEYNKYNCKSNYGIRKFRQEKEAIIPENAISPFAELPELVGERICTFLTQGDLLSLRLVCKVAKGWVEAPRNICKITIDLRRSSHLDRVVRRNSANFTNFRIRMENLNSQPTSWTEFANVFGPRMKVLKISSVSGFSRKIDLLLKCPSLEVVQLSDLCLRNVSPADLAKIGTNFANYRVFELDDLSAAKAAHVATLLGWITGSDSLKHVRLPFIQFQNGEEPKLPSKLLFGDEGQPSEEAVMKEYCRKDILTPLIRSLDKVKKGGRGGSRLESIDVERICLNFDNDSGLLQELAGACYRNGVRIRNVPFGQLYPKTSSVNGGANNAEILETIESCRGLHLGKIYVGHLKNMKSLTCSIGFGLSPPNPSALDYAKELDFPSLEVMDLNIFSLSEIVHKKVVVTLLTTQRPSVSRVSIAWNLNSVIHFPVTGTELGNSFPNLRRLELALWSADWQAFQDLFAALAANGDGGGGCPLEELKIKDCKALSDRAFSGVGKIGGVSPFKKLTNLKKLKIRCYDEGVTDESLSEAFSTLPLRTLSIHFIGESSLTVRGLSSLNRLPFKNSIQYLHLQLATGTSFGQVRKCTNQFDNLKNCIID